MKEASLLTILKQKTESISCSSKPNTSQTSNTDGASRRACFIYCGRGSISKLCLVNRFQQNYMVFSKIWSSIPCGLVSSAVIYISMKHANDLKNYIFDVAAFYLHDTVTCTAVNVSNGASIFEETVQFQMLWKKEYSQSEGQCTAIHLQKQTNH